MLTNTTEITPRHCQRRPVGSRRRDGPVYTWRERQKDFGLEVGRNEGPEGVEFAIERGLDVVGWEDGGEGGGYSRLHRGLEEE